MANRDKNERLVDGYVREQKLEIPLEIISLIFLWYHLELYIFKIGKHQELNKEKTTVTQNSDSYVIGTCYGSVSMPSTDYELIYEYTVRILQTNGGVAIGIDDAKCYHIDSWFIGSRQTRNYGMQCWDGTRCCMGDTFGSAYAKKSFQDKDTDIKMIYNAHESTLSFIIDGTDYGVAYNNIHKQEGLEYRLAIYLARTACVELIDFSTKSALD